MICISELNTNIDMHRWLVTATAFRTVTQTRAHAEENPLVPAATQSGHHTTVITPATACLSPLRLSLDLSLGLIIPDMSLANLPASQLVTLPPDR